MGYRTNPYEGVRNFYHGEEFILGNIKYPTNPFRWDTIILNLPGGYVNPAMARILGWNESRKHVATDMLIYIDDI